MRTINDALLNEQIQTARKPAVNFQIQEYGYPTESNSVKYNHYDWEALTTGQASIVSGCYTSNGTLVFLDANGQVFRFENATASTDFSTWTPVTAAEASYNVGCIRAHPTSGEVIQFGVETYFNEFWGYENKLYCKISNDHGETWGDWEYIIHYPQQSWALRQRGAIWQAYYGGIHWLCAEYKPNGDIRVFIITIDDVGGRTHTLYTMERNSGTWDTYWSGARVISPPSTMEQSTMIYVGNIMDGAVLYDYSHPTSLDCAYDEDWVVLIMWTQGQETLVKPQIIMYGDGNNVPIRIWQQDVSAPYITSAKKKINSFSELTNFSYSGMRNSTAAAHRFHSMEEKQGGANFGWVDPSRVGGSVGGNIGADGTSPDAGYSTYNSWDATRGEGGGGSSVATYGEEIIRSPEFAKALQQFADALKYNQSGGEYTEGMKGTFYEHKLLQSLTEDGAMDISRAQGTSGTYLDASWMNITAVTTVYPQGYLLKIDNHPLIMVIHADDELLFFSLRPDYTPEDGVFHKAFVLDINYPLQLINAGDYLFGFNYFNDLYVTPSPVEWQDLTAGTGAGSYLEIPQSKIYGLKETVAADNSSLAIVLDNSDGYFNSPGSGDLSVLKRGSRINLNIGYNISGVDVTDEAARYFVDRWEYSREPNLSYFTLYCVDGMKLLDDYQFPREACWNDYEEEYTIYELIEKIVAIIGGTVSYTTRSSLINTMYPYLEIAPGTTAGSILRRLFSYVSDVYYWYGADLHILNPQTTDENIYSYSFPT